MKKLLSILLFAGLMTFVSCGLSKKDKETELKQIESLRKDSIARLKNDLVKFKLLGKVHIFSEIKYQAVDSFGQIKKKGIDEKSTIVFNVEGNVTERKILPPNNSLKSKNIYKYDNKYN